MVTPKFRLTLPLLLATNPRQAVSRPISIINSKSLPCLRAELTLEGEGLVRVVETRTADLTGGGSGMRGYRSVDHNTISDFQK